MRSPTKTIRKSVESQSPSCSKIEQKIGGGSAAADRREFFARVEIGGKSRNIIGSQIIQIETNGQSECFDTYLLIDSISVSQHGKNGPEGCAPSAFSAAENKINKNLKTKHKIRYIKKGVEAKNIYIYSAKKPKKKGQKSADKRFRESRDFFGFRSGILIKARV